MIDYLLRFDGEAEAIAALPDLRVAPVFGFSEAEIDDSLRGAALVSQTMGAGA